MAWICKKCGSEVYFNGLETSYSEITKDRKIFNKDKKFGIKKEALYTCRRDSLHFSKELDKIAKWED